ncbi:DNA cytosine methyltransferase [Nesterenkonia rhizosphaerae]|uniref:DNA (cytosine-5-)-methyltransferase n=1 Tax=Nesterenkonia rhizosphaerae TaxID=1348272 RepID=A0ABP9G1X7_9MICC
MHPALPARRLTHAELFSGYGGLALAVEQIFNADLAWYAEYEAAPSKIMARHWPGVPNHGDVTAIDWAAVEPVDIISGGSPCQDVSAAGRRAGMTEGTRSNLWVAMREAIATIKPTLVIWENVRGAHSAAAYSAVESEPGLLGAPGDAYLRATGRVLGDLASLGYDAEWRTLPASSVGAPHRRERVFILAWRRDAVAEDHDGRRDGRGYAPSGGSRRAGADAQTFIPTGASGGTGSATPVALLPTPQANLGSNGGSQHPDKRRAGGHSVSIQDVVEHLLPTPLTTDGHNPSDADTQRNSTPLRSMHLLPTPRASHGDKGGPNQRDSAGHFDLPAIGNLLPTPKAGDADFGLPRTSGRPPERSTHLATRLHYTDFGDYTPAVARWERVLGRPAPAPTELSPRGKRRLSEHFTEFMMGVPAGWICDTPDITRNDKIRAAGNGVVPQQAIAALTNMLHYLPALRFTTKSGRA